MSNSYYSDEEDLDIRVSRRRGVSPSPVHYVEARSRPTSYYPTASQPGYLVPGPERTIITSRTRSRERSRDRRTPPASISTAAPPAPTPVIINNRIYNDHSSDEEDDRHMQVHHSRRRSHSRGSLYSHSRSPSSSYMTREEYEAERALQELRELKISKAREREELRVQKEYREEAELQRAKRDLDEIRNREARISEEKHLKSQVELQKYQEEMRLAEKAKQREKEAADAVERFQKKEQERLAKQEKEKQEREKEFQRRLQEERQKELDRIAKAKKEKEENEKEYQRRLREDLIKSGLDEKAIAAILKKERIPEPPKPQAATADTNLVAAQRPTYTRMARKHLSIETLRTYHVEWEFDSDPEYVLIKRWVPEWEQDSLWRHTRAVREKRSSKLVLEIEDKKSRRHEPEFEWVRKKSDHRKRSKSPALLMYLAGAKPA
ncbi:Reticulocyte-binding protein 2-like protein a [Colletotrichum trifolii]|uniref:Reticulocyte-binding protein 2-like protein a n=1 Tax=Colletotrichum trifolii TaxID=5466 RepID=A0A4R8PRJ3_COLTR|nr:Reticulocyte-binding protein 2-like protein a [Colletotrichum trifolii]